MQPPTTTPTSCFQTNSPSFKALLEGPNATDFFYAHQIEAVKKINSHFDDAKTNIALCVLPTGTGKSGCGVMIAYALSASRVLVITPSQQISEQLAVDFSGSPDDKKSVDAFLVKRRVVTGSFHSMLPPFGLVRRSKQLNQKIRGALVVVNAHKIGSKSSFAIEDLPQDFDLVIIDEAHHYPATTWKTIVDHFPNSKRLFFTATPRWCLDLNYAEHLCYCLEREKAVARGIIRKVEFVIAPDVDDDDDDDDDKKQEAGVAELRNIFRALASQVKRVLQQHDKEDSRVRHQAMILTQSLDSRNPAHLFEVEYNRTVIDDADRCQLYVAETEKSVVENFKAGQFRTVVVIGRLLEGFDHSKVSVVCIARNVRSRILFSQFVGRAVRKCSPDDPVPAVVVSHPKFKQKRNYDNFEKQAKVEETDVDNDNAENVYQFLALNDEPQDEEPDNDEPMPDVDA